MDQFALRHALATATISFPDGDFAVAELIHQASDDQMALAICMGAVACCGLIMYFSHHVGRLTGHIRMHESGSETARGMLHSHPVVVSTALHDKAA